MGAVDSARQVKPLRRPSAGRHIEPDRLSVGEFAISKGDRGDLELALRRPSCQKMMTNLMMKRELMPYSRAMAVVGKWVKTTASQDATGFFFFIS